MIEYKVILGILATLITLISYAFYYRGIFKGKTKPHFFSWFIWSILVGIAFAAQLTKGAGPGAWATGVTALLCLSVAIVAFFKGTRDFPLVDWLCLTASFVAIALWVYTKDPTASIILITLTDLIAYIPTVRKSYHRPHEETLITYVLSAVIWTIGLFALESFALANWLYTGSLILTNVLFVTMVMIRRRSIPEK